MTVATSPVALNARIDPRLSRWLWLVKWLLIIPHLIALFFLWVAFGVLSVVAFVTRLPATLDIAYPEHLSRGLIWVKWILALPHYVIIAFFVCGGYAVYRTGTSAQTESASNTLTSGGLIGLLVLLVGIALLLTGRYPRGLFDLLLGMHRWVLRVAAYTSLMTDQYPPFRLDMGGSEPAALIVATIDAPDRRSPLLPDTGRPGGSPRRSSGPF